MKNSKLLQDYVIYFEYLIRKINKINFLIATDVSVADNQTFTTSTAKNASLIVRASDSSSAQILKYIIQIQNPIENASIHTNPVDTTEIIHDGSKD